MTVKRGAGGSAVDRRTGGTYNWTRDPPRNKGVNRGGTAVDIGGLCLVSPQINGFQGRMGV
jgi:hypothetical protein